MVDEIVLLAPKQPIVAYAGAPLGLTIVATLFTPDEVAVNPSELTMVTAHIRTRLGIIVDDVEPLVEVFDDGTTLTILVILSSEQSEFLGKGLWKIQVTAYVDDDGPFGLVVIPLRLRNFGESAEATEVTVPLEVIVGAVRLIGTIIVGAVGETGLTGPSGGTARRHQTIGDTSYEGTAVTGSSSLDEVWVITKLVVASNGSVTTTEARDVAWTDRFTAVYS